MTKNNNLHKEMKSIIKRENTKSKSKTDGVFIVSCFKDKEGHFEIDTLVNGITTWEMDNILREMYASVYEIRKREDGKMKNVDKKLRETNGD